MSAGPSPDVKPFSQSVNDAQVLLWFASREGKALPADTIQVIAEADLLLSSGKRDPGLESRFWCAFRDLSAAMQPVTVDSIRATYGYQFAGHGKASKRLGDALSTKRWYSCGALIVLMLLLVTQIYWYIGTTYRTDLEAHREEMDRVSGSLREMSLQNASLNNKLVTKIKANDLGDHGTTVANISYFPDLEEIRSEQKQIDVDFFNNTRRLDRLNLILAGDACLLDHWDIVTSAIFYNFTAPTTVLIGDEQMAADSPCNAQSNRETGKLIQQSLWAERFTDSDLLLASNSSSIPGLEHSKAYQNILDALGGLKGNQQKIELSLESSKSTLAILNQYILPLLYGVLGSLAYTLRALSIEIQNVTFTRGSDIRYSLRWPLGMLAGVTVGLFFDQTKLSGFAAITPLGIAFLAGYGVELVFTGLDKLVRAFTGSEGDTAKPATP